MSKHLTTKVAATQTFVRGAWSLYDAALATARVFVAPGFQPVGIYLQKWDAPPQTQSIPIQTQQLKAKSNRFFTFYLLLLTSSRGGLLWHNQFPILKQRLNLFLWE
jgi:hypothetical protein